ncbi:MAG: hypothetical protein AB1597_02390 [Chloroflexota bacterium]
MKQRTGIYYGWWVVAACFLISLVSGGFVVLGFTSIIDPLVFDFGWSYALVSIAFSLRGAESGLLAPVAGLLADRFGPWKLLLFGSTCLGLSVVATSLVNSLASLFIVLRLWPWL